MAPVLVTLDDLEGHSPRSFHSPFAGLFKCNPSNICAVFYQISTDSAFALSFSDSWASCLHQWRRTIMGEGLLWRRSLTNSSVFRWWNEVEQFSSLSSSVQTKTSPQPAGTAPTDDQTPCTRHARRRSSSPGIHVLPWPPFYMRTIT